MPQPNETLSLMQPYFFPYIGYFSLIKKSDFFIFFDTPQYERSSWMNRNRIRHPNPTEESNYIMAQLAKAHYTTALNKREITKTFDWRNKFFGQLEVYKKNAPYYHSTIEMLNESLKINY